MVKRQRRMTVKKNSGKGSVKPKPAPTKGKKLVRSSSQTKRPASKTDRANQAMKTLLKALQNQTEE